MLGMLGGWVGGFGLSRRGPFFSTGMSDIGPFTPRFLSRRLRLLLDTPTLDLLPTTGGTVSFGRTAIRTNLGPQRLGAWAGALRVGLGE